MRFELDAQTGRWAWPASERELAIGIVRGAPAIVLYRAGVQTPEVLPITPAQCEAFAEAFEAASDVAEGVARLTDLDQSALIR